MADKEVYAILDYLKKYGRTNTFRLARQLRIERHKLLDILKTLKEKKAIEFKSGNVGLTKFPPKEEKMAEEKPPKAKVLFKAKAKPKKIKRKIKHKKKPKKVKHKKKEVSKVSENLQEENQKLREEVSRLTEKFDAEKQLLHSSAKEIEELKSEIRGLEQKASIPPRVIERTIVKKVPVEKIIRITRIKRVPVKVKEKPKKFGFKLPTINVPKIKIPKITMPKIKIDFKKIKKGLRTDVEQLQQKIKGSSKTIKKWWSKRKTEEEWLKGKERKLKKKIKSVHFPKIIKKY